MANNDEKTKIAGALADLVGVAIGNRTTGNITRAIIVSIIGTVIWGATQLEEHGVIQIGCTSCEERIAKLETTVDKHRGQQELFENRVNNFVAKGARVTPDMLENAMNQLRREHIRSVQDTKEDVIELKRDLRELRSNLYRSNRRVQ